MNDSTNIDGDSSFELLPWESRNKCVNGDFSINLAALANRNKPKKVGDIGYTFTKYFPGHGNFEGTVVEIRDGADGGRDRRCRYKDGDVEDLSIDDLIQLTNPMKAGDRESKKSSRDDLISKGKCWCHWYCKGHRRSSSCFHDHRNQEAPDEQY